MTVWKNCIRIRADVPKLLTQIKSAVLPGISKVAKIEIPCGLFTLVNMRKIGIFCCYKIIIEEGSSFYRFYSLKYKHGQLIRWFLFKGSLQGKGSIWFLQDIG